MTIQIKLKFKKDRFTKKRGGSSQFIELLCGACGNQIGAYQKDGPGNLHRLYLDRLYPSCNPLMYSNKFYLNELTTLVCTNEDCQSTIGSPMLYNKNGEKRLAFNLVGPIKKSKLKEKIFYP